MIDDISKGLQTIKEVVLFWKSSRKERAETQDKAIDAILSAANETRAYLADVRDGVQKPDREKERRLSELWRNAHTALIPIDYELADKCLIKADCWSDPTLFDDERYVEIPIDLNTIIDACRDLRRSQAIERL